MDLKKSLNVIDAKLQDVTHFNYDPRNLPDIHFTSLNDYYRSEVCGANTLCVWFFSNFLLDGAISPVQRHAIQMAKFVLKNVIYSMEGGPFDAPIFLLYMPRVYEDFVVNSLRESKALQAVHADTKIFAQGKPLRFDQGGSRIYAVN